MLADARLERQKRVQQLRNREAGETACENENMHGADECLPGDDDEEDEEELPEDDQQARVSGDEDFPEQPRSDEEIEVSTTIERSSNFCLMYHRISTYSKRTI